MTLQEFLNEWHDGHERLLVHTSGSTGEPKPLWVEKRRMEASARITCDFLGLKGGDTALLCMPLDFIAGKMMVVRALERGLRLVSVEPGSHPLRAQTPRVGSSHHPAATGDTLSGQLLCPGGSHASQLSPVDYPLDQPFDFAAMVPLQVWSTLQDEAERARLMAIRHLIIGGGAIDDRLADQLRAFPNAVWSTYGMTETLSHIALRRLSGPEASEWYTPFAGVGVSLSSEGCLVIDAPHVCAQTLLTNDMAEIVPATDVDGPSAVRFRILGRRDNVICSGGLKIQIEEVERRLQPHLPVPFLITKRRDAMFGEAVVLLFEGGASLEDSLRDACSRVLPKYWVPRFLVPVDQLPLTATGKPARKEAERLAR